MTPNIASPIFNTLLTLFFLVIIVGCATGAFAAIQLGKAQKRYEADEAQLASASPGTFDLAAPEPATAGAAWTADQTTEYHPEGEASPGSQYEAEPVAYAQHDDYAQHDEETPAE